MLDCFLQAARTQTAADMISAVLCCFSPPAGRSAPRRLACSKTRGCWPSTCRCCADLAVNETYRYLPGTTLDVPIIAFGGNRDPKADADEVAAWQLHTRAPLAAHIVSGCHFFVQTSLPEVLDTVAADLATRQARLLSAGG